MLYGERFYQTIGSTLRIHARFVTRYCNASMPGNFCRRRGEKIQSNYFASVGAAFWCSLNATLTFAIKAQVASSICCRSTEHTPDTGRLGPMLQPLLSAGRPRWSVSTFFLPSLITRVEFPVLLRFRSDRFSRGEPLGEVSGGV